MAGLPEMMARAPVAIDQAEGAHIVALEQNQTQKQRRQRTLDLSKLVSDLKKERDRLSRTIAALLGSASSALSSGGKNRGRPKGSTTKGKKRKRGGLTPAGRRRLSLAMKKRWAERKKKMKGKEK
jgi:hypothetical protein